MCSDSINASRCFRRCAASGAAALALVLAAENPAVGEGVMRDSLGTVSSGRGATNIAYSDNLAVLNDNPAGLAAVGNLRFDVDLALVKTDVNFRRDAVPPNPAEDADNDFELFALPSVFGAWRVTERPAPIVVGLGFFMPAGYGARYYLDNGVFGESKYLTKSCLYKFMPAAAVDLGRGFSAGAGIGLAYETARFVTPFTFQSGPLRGGPAKIEADADGLGYSWNAGLQYRPTEHWTFGLSYVSETRIDLDGSFKVDGTGVPGLEAARASYDAEMVNTWPRSVGLGASYNAERWTASVEGLWFNWATAFDDITFRLRNGTNPMINGAVGSTSIRDSLPLEWHDSFSVRVGGEYKVTADDTVRAGYIYMTDPVPERTLTPLIPAITQHSITVGYGHRFGKISVDFAYMFYFAPRRHVGTSEIVGPGGGPSEYEHSSVEVFAHWFFLGASASF